MYEPSINIILSHDLDGVIGDGTNSLAYRCSHDMSRFQRLTIQTGEESTSPNMIVMGKNTFRSLGGKLLKDRINVVLSSTIGGVKDTHVCKSWRSVFNLVLSKKPPKVFIIGGKQIYEDFLSSYNTLVDNIYITKFELRDYKGESLVRINPDEMTRGFYLDDEIATKCFVRGHIRGPQNAVVVYQTWKPVQNLERGYLRKMAHILFFCPKRKTRNGEVRSTFGVRFVYRLDGDCVPVLTTKQVAWKTCIKELLWFLRGETNNGTLEKVGVKIWSQNSTREFLDIRGLTKNIIGDLGPIYGFQWRHCGAEYKGTKEDYTGKGIDQIEDAIHLLKTDPTSRRMIVSAWNVGDLSKMSLPPCHLLFQFYVDSTDKTLWIQLYQRSGDMFLGVPFNILSYSVLLRLICLRTGLKPGGIVHIIGDAHVYETHCDAIETQLKRQMYGFPRLSINKKEKFEDYTDDDFKLVDYKHGDKIYAPMSA